jgi:DNA-binding SARP family transcriptional activator
MSQPQRSTRTAEALDRRARHALCDVSACFTVRVLGEFSVSCNEVALDVDTWPRRGASLLRLLAVTPGHRRLREHVVETLWPEASPEMGGANLRCALYRVRRTLHPSTPSPIVSTSGWVLLNPTCTWRIDLDQFESLVDRAGDDPERLAEAAALVPTELLVEDRYAAWAEPVREHITRQWRAICLRLARLQGRGCSHQDAVRWCERILERDPLDEEALRGLLVCLGAAEHGSEALRRYHRFVRQLRAELSIPPCPETLSLAARLKADLDRAAAEPTQALLTYSDGWAHRSPRVYGLRRRTSCRRLCSRCGGSESTAYRAGGRRAWTQDSSSEAESQSPPRMLRMAQRPHRIGD